MLTSIAFVQGNYIQRFRNLNIQLLSSLLILLILGPTIILGSMVVTLHPIFPILHMSSSCLLQTGYCGYYEGERSSPKSENF